MLSQKLYISSFKAKYGQDCHDPYKFGDLNLPDLATKNRLEGTNRQMQVIRQSLKNTSDRQRSSAKLHFLDKEIRFS